LDHIRIVEPCCPLSVPCARFHGMHRRRVQLGQLPRVVYRRLERLGLLDSDNTRRNLLELNKEASQLKRSTRYRRKSAVWLLTIAAVTSHCLTKKRLPSNAMETTTAWFHRVDGYAITDLDMGDALAYCCNYSCRFMSRDQRILYHCQNSNLASDIDQKVRYFGQELSFVVVQVLCYFD